MVHFPVARTEIWVTSTPSTRTLALTSSTGITGHLLLLSLLLSIILSRFYLSFENALCRDYITEKAFNSLKLNTIPVVLGGSDYESILPPGSFINARQFYSPEHLANYLYKVLNNSTLHDSYFQWRPYYNIQRSVVSQSSQFSAQCLATRVSQTTASCVTCCGRGICWRRKPTRTCSTGWSGRPTVSTPRPAGAQSNTFTSGDRKYSNISVPEVRQPDHHSSLTCLRN